MKLHRRIAGLLLSLLLATILLPAEVSAAGSIDLNREVQLNISYQDQGKPLEGAEFSVYRVADVDAYGEFQTTEEFSQYNVDIRGENDEAWTTLAFTLEGYVLRDQIEPADCGKTDADGRVSFPSEGGRLTPGLYLVISVRHTQDGWYYDALPFMVMLPALDESANDWLYIVDASAKHDAQEVPEIPQTTELKVQKIWKDDGYEKQRPEEVVIQLLKDGKVTDTKTLNEKNHWRYTWTDLDAGAKWTVTEQKVSGYTVEITREGSTCVVTNTYKDGKDVPSSSEGKLPQTGQTWWPVAVLLIAGLLLIISGLLLHRSDRKKR